MTEQATTFKEGHLQINMLADHVDTSAAGLEELIRNAVQTDMFAEMFRAQIMRHPEMQAILGNEIPQVIGGITTSVNRGKIGKRIHRFTEAVKPLWLEMSDHKAVSGDIFRELRGRRAQEKLAKKNLLPEARKIVRRALGIAIQTMKDAEGRRMVVPDDRQDTYLAAFLKCDDVFVDEGGKFDSRAKMECMDGLVGIDPEFVSETFGIIDEIPTPSINDASIDEMEGFGRRLKMSGIEFIQRHKNRLMEDPTERALVRKVMEIFRDIFSNPEVEFYLLANYSADQFWLDRILECCRNDEVIINGLFCPDWSGEMREGVWHYNFEDVGTTAGVVAKKGIPVLAHLQQVMADHGIGTVRVIIDYPAFECPLEGYRHEETGNFVPFDEFCQRLEASGRDSASIMEEMGISAESGITTRLMSNAEFHHEVEEVLERFNSGQFPEGFTVEDWEGAIEAIYAARRNFYPKWYPMNPGETAEEYQARMMGEIIPRQLVEYYVFQTRYKREENTLLVCADNRIMNQVMATATGVPIVTGQGKGTVSYSGQ